MTTPNPPYTPYQIVLLRHGESVGNAEGYFQGQADFPLTETGKAQSRALVKRWMAEGVSYDRVISSPLARASQTAEILASGLGLPVELDPLWMEWDNGRLAGMRPAEAAEKYPRPAFINPYTPLGQTGESQWDFFLRAGRAVKSLVERPPGRYLVVSHGGFLNMVMYALLGIVPQANLHGPRFRFRNIAFASLTYNPAVHKWYVEGVNDHQHWDAPENDDLP
jgi:2,3-bisphosphoglycerate-dependent phosphoglycerate mutase